MGDRPAVPTDRERTSLSAPARVGDGRAATPGVTPVPAALPTSPPPSGNPVRASSDATAPRRPLSAQEASPRRPGAKFGAAADGWDAYNSWLDRVRQPPPSRQAVIAKSLYSVSSYKSWADKARGAFDPTGVPGVPAPLTSGGKVIK